MHDYSVITLDYTFGNVNVLVGQVDADDSDADLLLLRNFWFFRSNRWC